MLTYGRKTGSTVILSSEAHKLHKSFRVAKPESNAVPVRKSQPVKLTADGEITPIAANDNRNLVLGISIHDARPGERATIIMKGHAIILCQASSTVAPGPVQYTGYASSNPAGSAATALPENPTEEWYGVNTVEVAAATDVDIFGQAIEAAANGEPVEVVVLA